MTNTEKLMICIANAGGPIRSDELALQTGIPCKNHNGYLATAIATGLVQKALIKNGSNRTVSEYRIGAAYTPKRLQQVMAPVESVIKAEDGRPLLRTVEEVERETAHPHAQPAVAQNTGSAGSASPPGHSTEARAPIEVTAGNAQLVGELAQALDRIAELERELESAKLLIKPGLRLNYVADSGTMISTLQSNLCNGISLTICEKNVFMQDMDEREYDFKPNEFDRLLDALKFVHERLAA